jgi:hypothetical protein
LLKPPVVVVRADEPVVGLAGAVAVAVGRFATEVVVTAGFLGAAVPAAAFFSAVPLGEAEVTVAGGSAAGAGGAGEASVCWTTSKPSASAIMTSARY